MDQNIYSRAIALIESGDWNGAHGIVQELHTAEAALIHAYLHKIEGDVGNANYWYKRAGQPPFSGRPDEELQGLKQKFGSNPPR